MADKKRILFYNLDGAGVNYFRTQTPAMELERNHSNEFYVEINNQIDFNDPKTTEYLKSFDIIHYHRQLVPDVTKMHTLAAELKESGVKLVVDIDDYWKLHPKHPYYNMAVQKKMHLPIIENLKIADFVTTTTDLFAEKIKDVTGKENVIVLQNSVDPIWMKQFRDNEVTGDTSRVVITYMAGSSHLVDVEQLEGVVNVLQSDPELRDKFKIIIAGWDSEGSTTQVTFNQEFGAALQMRGLWNQKLIKLINRSKGNIDLIPGLPDDLKEKYRDNIFSEEKRDIESKESVYYTYEKILTDNHRLITDSNYKEWLDTFSHEPYHEEGNFGRRWTKKANSYATTLNETDIVIAPLADNEFNSMKSNLKQVECWSRKLPIVCSDVAPYNVDGRHMENCILIPNKKNSHKYWKKHLKSLILDSELRKRLGEQLYEDFKVKYNLVDVTKLRAEFYNSIA